MNIDPDTDEEPPETDISNPPYASVIKKPLLWTLIANQDQILKYPELAVHFKRPCITQSGLIIPNRVAAEFERIRKNQAIALYHDIRSKGLTVLRNWLD